MTDLKSKQETSDWEDAGWEEDRLRYEAEITRLKRASVAHPQPMSDRADQVPASFDASDSNAPSIPFPLSDKPEYFPGFIARSSLFQAGRPGAGNVTELRHVRSQKNYDVTVTGPRLSMRDKHVWETAVHIAKETSSDMAHAFEVALNDFAARMGLADRSSKTLNSIWGSLERLCQVRVQFKLPAGHEGCGSLLATAVRSEGRTYLRVNPDFTWAAFALDSQFRIQSARRGRLSSSLAQWLHDFLSTHTENIDFTVGYLRDLSGWAGPSQNFPKALRLALNELASAVPVLVEAYSIDAQSKFSGRWVVKLTRGPEKPQFTRAKALQAKGGSKASATPVGVGKRRKGGVVL